MSRGYQENFSLDNQEMFDTEIRRRKAMTMKKVLEEVSDRPLAELCVLNAGGSTGYIDKSLAPYFGHITCIDIDESAITHADQDNDHNNLDFAVGDVMAMNFPDDCFDIVISSQVYEHVADPVKMMGEIHRVLKPGGICYFSANSRIMWREVHYGLPLLSVIPRPLAHLYMRLDGKGKYYYEKHFTYWGLRSLVKQFQVRDYTEKMLADPERYGIDYMISPQSFKHKLALFLVRYCYKIFPAGYIWILRK